MGFWKRLLDGLLDFLGASTNKIITHGIDRARKELNDKNDGPVRDEQQDDA